MQWSAPAAAMLARARAERRQLRTGCHCHWRALRCAERGCFFGQSFGSLVVVVVDVAMVATVVAVATVVEAVVAVAVAVIGCVLVVVVAVVVAAWHLFA